MLKRTMIFLALAPMLFSARDAAARQLVLVESGVSRVPIVIAADAGADTRQAAQTLAGYIEKISGARPPVLEGRPDPLPESAVWVGCQPVLAELFPGSNFDFQHPEEILLVCDGRNLAIAGRDRFTGEKQVEHGTVNAVYEFLERNLEVRWLWPGELGEDIIPRKSIALAPFDYRFHPPFRTRHLWPRSPREWHTTQRIWHYSMPYDAGHGYTDWWEKYGETHPEYFALRPDGTRRPGRDPKEIKLCVSNPAVAAQWLENAEKILRENPDKAMISGSPNDGPGFCVCEKCRSWNHPDAPAGVLTDRYVKYWNILALGLKERFPDRKILLGVMAYSAYSSPPLGEKLEDNIAVLHVGHFPLDREESRRRQKEHWQAWADMATLMIYRPNLWYWAGGVWGLPEMSLRKTAEDWRFLADNRCEGIIVDVMRHHWATQGPMYYLLGKLTWDPRQDRTAVMNDYYRRAFGPAAGEMDAYWKLMENAHYAAINAPQPRNIAERINNLTGVYNETLIARADAILRRAEAKATGLFFVSSAAGSDIYRRRVAFVRAGLEHTRLMMSTVPLMKQVRESRDVDSAAANQVFRIWEEIERNAKEGGPYSISFGGLMGVMAGGYMGGVQAYFGPPTAEMLEPVVQLAPARWEPAWNDDFARAELGGDWQVLDGAWSIADGHLVSAGGRIVTTRKFPGLQRIEFEASITPSVEGIISDMSPLIHYSPENGGYLLQLGGYYNKANSLQRRGTVLVEKREEQVLEPGRVYRVTGEFDGSMLRLSLDGKTILELPEQRPLLGDGYEQVGFYVYEGNVKINSVKVYTSPVVEAAADTSHPESQRAW